jgi:hypothetical protein
MSGKPVHAAVHQVIDGRIDAVLVPFQLQLQADKLCLHQKYQNTAIENPGDIDGTLLDGKFSGAGNFH